MATLVKVNGKTVSITATGFKVGSKGKVIDPSTFYKTLPNKSDRRKLRKTARANGFNAHAAARTAA